MEKLECMLRRDWSGPLVIWINLKMVIWINLKICHYLCLAYNYCWIPDIYTCLSSSFFLFFSCVNWCIYLSLGTLQNNYLMLLQLLSFITVLFHGVKGQTYLDTIQTDHLMPSWRLDLNSLSKAMFLMCK